jgi:hypothetical protein
MTTTTQPSAAQLILNDTAVLKRDLTTILELARSTALPMPGESLSVIEAMLGLLQNLVSRVERMEQSLEAMHQRFDQPGIAQVLRRMLDAD